MTTKQTNSNSFTNNIAKDRPVEGQQVFERKVMTKIVDRINNMKQDVLETLSKSDK